MAKRNKSQSAAQEAAPIANKNTTDLEVPITGLMEASPEKESETIAPTGNPTRENAMKDILVNRAKKLDEELRTGALMQPFVEPITDGNKEPPETPEPVDSPPPKEGDAIPPAQPKDENEPVAGSDTAVQAQAQSEKHKIKVNGRELEVSNEELIELAQKSAAAEEKFQQAARMRDEALRAQFGPQPQPQYTQPTLQQQAAPQNSTPANQIPIPDEMVDKFAQSMNYGSAEEQRQATRELIASVVNVTGRNQPTPEAIVQAATYNALAAAQHQQALAKVGEEYADVFKDQDLTQLAMNQMQRTTYERTLRQQAGLPVEQKSGYDLMRESCQYVKEKFMKADQASEANPPASKNPIQAAPMQDRIERKRVAPQPPAAANKVATENPKKQPWEKTPKQIFAEMRKARNQQVYQ